MKIIEAARIREHYVSGFVATVLAVITLYLAMIPASFFWITVFILGTCYFMASCLVRVTVEKAQRKKYSSAMVMRSERETERNESKPTTFIELLACIKETNWFTGILALFYAGMTLYMVVEFSNLAIITVMILVACAFISAYVANAAVEKAQRRNRL